MSLPIKPEQLPDRTTLKEITKIFQDSLKASGKKVTEQELIQPFRHTSLNSAVEGRSSIHVDKKQQARIFDTWGKAYKQNLTPNTRQALNRGLRDLGGQKNTPASTGGNIFSGLAGLFGRKKAPPVSDVQPPQRMIDQLRNKEALANQPLPSTPATPPSAPTRINFPTPIK